MNERKERQYLFTNLKAFLITTVVFGHFIQCMPDSILRNFLMLYIYSFHMPAFIFVSGYFSKNVEKGKKTAFEKYFIPFLYMSVIYIVIYLILTGNSCVRFFVPVFAAWYVLVIFYYKIILGLVAKYPAKIVWISSLVISLLAGLVPFIGSSFCLERTFSFFPFFLAGYYLKKEQIEKFKQRIPFYVSIGMLIAIGAGFFYYVCTCEFNYQPMLCNVPYASYGFVWWQGILFKLYFTVMALVLIFLLIHIFQEKKYRFSYIGDNTMSVYALHCIAYLIVKHGGMFSDINPLVGICISFFLAIGVVLVLSIPKINQIYMTGIKSLAKLEKRYVLQLQDEE